MAPSPPPSSNQKPGLSLTDLDYDSGDDSDFDPTSAPVDDNNASSSDSDSDVSVSLPKKRKRTLSSESAQGTGGLIKTRSQRALEIQSRSGGVVTGAVTTDVDALWAAMNSPAPPAAPTPPPPTTTTTTPLASATGEKMVAIKQSYEFAGKTITEEKLVPLSSETARVHFSSSTPTPAPETIAASSSTSRRPPPKKRASAFDAAAAARRSKSAQPAKINTLEKSRLDWAGFVDKEGIGDDLKKWNKGDKGYLDRQAFLGRVDENRDRQWREGNKKG